MTTERLYYADAYTLDFSAAVLEYTTVKDNPAVVLDRTYFYPEGGGQLPDHGTLNGIAVTDVQTRESDRAVLHVLAALLGSAQVEGRIDGERRADLRLHHTGQHILSQALSRAAQAETVSVHMSLDSMTIDVNRIGISAEDWTAVEVMANEIVRANLPVRCWFSEPDELAALPIRKLPDVTGKVRIVNVGGFDVTACGGTHVRQTGEIGLIKVVRTERRGNTTRLEFRCGVRALDDYRSKNELVNRLVSDLTVGAADVPEAVRRLQDENRTLRAELKTAREFLIEAEARQLLESATLRDDLRIVSLAVEGRNADDLKMLAQRLTTSPNVIALIGLAGEKAQLLFGRSENLPHDMAKLLKGALAVLKSERGGGRPNFAQGGGVVATLAEVAAALDQASAALSD